jgi:hypothetical protein
LRQLSDRAAEFSAAMKLLVADGLKCIIGFDRFAGTLVAPLGLLTDEVSYFNLFDVEQLGRETGILPAAPLPADSTSLMVLSAPSSVDEQSPLLVPYTFSQLLSSMAGLWPLYFPEGAHPMLASSSPSQPNLLLADDVFLAHRPVGAVSELVLYMVLISTGSAIAFAHCESTSSLVAEKQDIVADMARLKPTVLSASAEDMNHLYDRLLSGGIVTGRVFKSMVEMTMHAKRWIGRSQNSWLERLLVFRKIQSFFGDRIRQFLVYGPGLRKEVAELLTAAVAPVTIIDGFQETAGAGLVAVIPNMFATDLPLLPHPSIQVMVEEGRLAIKGPCVPNGYFHDSNRSRFVFRDGWFVSRRAVHKNEDGTFSMDERRLIVVGDE